MTRPYQNREGDFVHGGRAPSGNPPPPPAAQDAPPAPPPPPPSARRLTCEETDRLARFDAVAAGALVVPAPTPDEDGVWSGGDAWTVTSAPPPGLIKAEVGGRAWLTADEAEALGAALLAAAQDARRLALI